MSGFQDLHSCTYIMTLTLMLTKSVQSWQPNTKGRCSKGASYTSRIQINGKRPRTCYRWKGVWGVWGRSNLPQKSPTVRSEPKFRPPPIKNSWIRPCDSTTTGSCYPPISFHRRRKNIRIREKNRLHGKTLRIQKFPDSKFPL